MSHLFYWRAHALRKAWLSRSCLPTPSHRALEPFRTNVCSVVRRHGEIEKSLRTPGAKSACRVEDCTFSEGLNFEEGVLNLCPVPRSLVCFSCQVGEEAGKVQHGLNHTFHIGDLPRFSQWKSSSVRTPVTLGQNPFETVLSQQICGERFEVYIVSLPSNGRSGITSEVGPDHFRTKSQYLRLFFSHCKSPIVQKESVAFLRAVLPSVWWQVPNLANLSVHKKCLSLLLETIDNWLAMWRDFKHSRRLAPLHDGVSSLLVVLYSLPQVFSSSWKVSQNESCGLFQDSTIGYHTSRNLPTSLEKWRDGLNMTIVMICPSRISVVGIFIEKPTYSPLKLPQKNYFLNPIRSEHFPWFVNRVLLLNITFTHKSCDSPYPLALYPSML